MIPEHDFFDVLISKEEVAERCQKVGAEISQIYQEEGFIAVGILRGCFLFYSELLKYVNCPVLVDFMFVSSYGNKEQSSGIVKIERDLQEDIRNKHVLLIDDIVDTGLTLSNLIEVLQVRKPKSIGVCTMLNKKCCRQSDLHVNHYCFEIGNDFVVGLGLDYKQYYRNMDFIGRLKPGKKEALDNYVDSISTPAGEQ